MINTRDLMKMAPYTLYSEAALVNVPAYWSIMPLEFQEKKGFYFYRDQFTFVLDDAELAGPIGVCFWGGDVVLDVAYMGRLDLWDRNRSYFDMAVATRLQHKPFRLEGTYCSLLSCWSGNYFHWTLEMLPMLDAVKQYQARTKEKVTILVEHNPQPWVIDSLAAFGFDKVKPIDNFYYSVEKLIVPPPGRKDGYTSPYALDFLSSVDIEGGEYERIYISRTDAQKRQIVNESEVIPILRDKGFVPVSFTDCEWSKQVSIAKGAKVVISPHGAGLANLAYNKQKPRIVEIATPEYINPCFYTLAGAMGAPYMLHIGDPEPGENIRLRPEAIDTLL